jgi:hypothetical protein
MSFFANPLSIALTKRYSLARKFEVPKKGLAYLDAMQWQASRAVHANVFISFVCAATSKTAQRRLCVDCLWCRQLLNVTKTIKKILKCVVAKTHKLLKLPLIVQIKK